MNDSVRIQRLSEHDTALARRTFHLLTAVFEEERAPLSDAYVGTLLARPGFWAMAAIEGDASVSGIHVAFVPADVEDDHALEFYRALGGEEAEVRIFTFDELHDGH